MIHRSLIPRYWHSLKWHTQMKVYTCVNHSHQRQYKWPIKYEWSVCLPEHSLHFSKGDLLFFSLHFFEESLDITPKYVFIPTNKTGQYSISLNCILTDNHTGRRHHEIHWWHNNKRLGAHSGRQARITKNATRHSFISTLFYTGDPSTIVGNYICESDPLRKHISVGFKTNQSPSNAELVLLLHRSFE